MSEVTLEREEEVPKEDNKVSEIKVNKLALDNIIEKIRSTEKTGKDAIAARQEDYKRSLALYNERMAKRAQALAAGESEAQLKDKLLGKQYMEDEYYYVEKVLNPINVKPKTTKPKLADKINLSVKYPGDEITLLKGDSARLLNIVAGLKFTVPKKYDMYPELKKVYSESTGMINSSISNAVKDNAYVKIKYIS